MRVSTIVMLLGAAACAAAAALLTKTWLAGRPEPPIQIVVPQAPPPPANRTVVVASMPLKFGMVLTGDALTEVPWPDAYVPADTFSSKEALIAGGQRIVLASMAKNEPVLASKITAPGQRASLSVMIGEGKKAVTIRVDDVLGVAGFVQPDDRVDILLTRGDRTQTAAGPAAGNAFTDVLLQNVRVLAIDQLAERNIQAKPVKAVTLEVDTGDAQKLVLAASVGQLALALRGAGWMQTSEARRIGVDDLPSSRPAEVVPSRPIEEIERGPLVTVIRGVGERKQYSVNGEPGHLGVPVGNRQALNSGEVPAGPDVDNERAPQAQPR